LAVERVPMDSRLLVRYEIGVNDEGEPIYRSRTLARVRSNSDDQNLWAVATALIGLQSYTVADVRRVDNFVLMEVV
jgi:hypothetical protein